MKHPILMLLFIFSFSIDCFSQKWDSETVTAGYYENGYKKDLPNRKKIHLYSESSFSECNSDGSKPRSYNDRNKAAYYSGNKIKLSLWAACKAKITDAMYVDKWHYDIPYLYIFQGTNYTTYDLENTQCSGGSNSIANGFPGVPFNTIDAAFVDNWSERSPKIRPLLYLFSGSQFCVYDLLANKLIYVKSIKEGFPGLPFKKVNAAIWVPHQIKTFPRLYLFGINKSDKNKIAIVDPNYNYRIESIVRQTDSILCWHSN